MHFVNKLLPFNGILFAHLLISLLQIYPQKHLYIDADVFKSESRGRCKFWHLWPPKLH